MEALRPTDRGRGRLGGGYLSKILKLSIKGGERRTSLIKIIHALLHGRRDATAVCDAASFIYASTHCLQYCSLYSGLLLCITNATDAFSQPI